MKKYSKKQKEALGNLIQEENAMLQRVTRVIRSEIVLLAIFAIFFVWGAFDLTDPFLPNVSSTLKAVFKWVGLVGAILFLVLVILSYISRRNGQKSLLKKIDEYEKMK